MPTSTPPRARSPRTRPSGHADERFVIVVPSTVMRALRISAVVVAAALATTCKHDEEDRESAWPVAWIDAACGKTYDNDCECSEPPWSSAEVCTQYLLQPVIRAQNAAIAAGLAFDEDCAYRMIDELEQLGCESLEGFRLADGCQAYHGDKELGDACTLEYWAVTATSGFHISDCKQGLVCALAGQRCTTPEMPWVELAADAMCRDAMGNSLGFCPDPQQQCDATSSQCVTPAALGEPCPNDFPCADSWCDDGTCVARKADDAACAESIECASLVCSEERCAEPGPSIAACYAAFL
jgi:hypothetical protein